MNPVATAKKPPAVLIIGGLDPTSGAGITADCAAVSALGCHPLAVITASTAQNTSEVTACLPVTNSHLKNQLQTLLREWTPDAIKIGLVPNLELLNCIVEVLSSISNIPPVVLDPVGTSSSGTQLSGVSAANWQPLLRLALVITPNHQEAMYLTNTTDVTQAKHSLTALSEVLLLTGTDSTFGNMITHHLSDTRSKGKVEREFQVLRKPGSYHGSGCALASAIAAHLAQGEALENAVEASLNNVDRWISGAFLPSDKAKQMILRHS